MLFNTYLVLLGYVDPVTPLCTSKQLTTSLHRDIPRPNILLISESSG